MAIGILFAAPAPLPTEPLEPTTEPEPEVIVEPPAPVEPPTLPEIVVEPPPPVEPPTVVVDPAPEALIPPTMPDTSKPGEGMLTMGVSMYFFK